MNTQLAAEEELDDYDGEESEPRFSGISLRDGETDLFRGVLVALIALAVGAVVLTQGYGDDGVDSATDDTSLTSGELTAGDPDGASTEGDAEAAATDPGAPSAEGVADDATMADGAVDDEATTGSTTADGTATQTSNSTATTTATTSPTLAGTARPAGEVDVVVLNATDRKGIAGQGTDLVEAAGYAVVPAANATDAIGSVIYYLEGYRADAIAVSQVFSDGLEGLVQPYDPTSPPAAGEDIGDAKVIVVLGVDDAIPIG